MADAAKRETIKTQFCGVIFKLTEAGRFPESDVDDALTQYNE